MITSLEVTRLRGVREAKLEELAPLTVLVGPNGCGKSTLLDAILIGASPVPDDAIGRSVRRHGGRNAGRWLVWNQGEEGRAEIHVRTAEGERTVVLSQQGPRVGFAFARAIGAIPPDSVVTFEADGTYSRPPSRGKATDHKVAGIRQARLVEPARRHYQVPLHELWEELCRRGEEYEAAARDAVAALVPGSTGVRSAREDGEGMLLLDYPDRSVPAELAGHGVTAALRATFELAAPEGSVILLEEPEAKLHSSAIDVVARAAVAALRRGVQVIVSTQSLEVIDALLYELEDKDGLDDMALFRLQLASDGKLTASRISGHDVLEPPELQED